MAQSSAKPSSAVLPSGSDGFPAQFLSGVAISTFQNSGDPSSNWGHFENASLPWWMLGKPTIAGKQKCGVANDFYNKYADAIQAAKDLGCTCFRLSLEWSRIEPEQGVIDTQAVERFRDIILCIRSQGMEPVVTLHHFVHPQWFEKLGAFEKTDNLPHFMRFVDLAAREYGSLVHMWLTFNEPSVYTFFGYIHGTFPPAKPLHLQLAGTVLYNLLTAHCIAYYKIKTTPGCEFSKVGIVHNIMRFQSRNDGFSQYMPHTIAVTGCLDYMWNLVQVRFLQTGVFDWQPLGPWACVVKGQWVGGTPPLDWLGLNYYSRVVGDWKLATTCNPGETMTDMEYALYPEGLIKAVELLAPLGVPLFVTETGAPDGQDVIRGQWIREYFGALGECIRRGYDVRGVMYWTLQDNFEWAHGFHQKFGLFPMPSEGNRVVLRGGAREFGPNCRKLEAMYSALHSGAQGGGGGSGGGNGSGGGDGNVTGGKDGKGGQQGETDGEVGQRKSQRNSSKKR